MPPQNQREPLVSRPPVPVEQPGKFLRPLANDTYGWVKNCYQVMVDPSSKPANRWVEIKIVKPDGLNPGLFLNKLCPDKETLKDNKNNNNARSAFYNGWIRLANGHPAAHAAALIERRIAAMKDLKQSQGVCSRELIGAVVWRLIIGMGNPNPLETSLTLHPQYGVPLIPGSAVKGLTRHGRLLDIGAEVGVFPLPQTETEEWRGKREPTPLEWLERLLLAVEEGERQKALAELQRDKSVQEAIRAASPTNPVTGPNTGGLLAQYGESFRRAFGTGQHQGEVVFLEALPLPGWTYELDVMTPHYGDYYQKDAPPADWLEPTPIAFLTIGQGSRFRFDVSGKDDALLGQVIDWLEKALSEWGAGGKTSAGYGEMESKA